MRDAATVFLADLVSLLDPLLVAAEFTPDSQPAVTGKAVTVDAVLGDGAAGSRKAADRLTAAVLDEEDEE